MSAVATVFVDDRENAMDRANGRKRRSGNEKSPMAYLESVFDADNRANSKKTPAQGGGLINYKVTRLTIADYCIALRGENGKPIIVAAVERKKWKDLASTIGGSRAETQPRDLREVKLKYGCFVYYIAEGSFSYADNTKIGGAHGKEFKALHSKLRHEIIRGIPFIQTKNAEHTVQMLTKMARDFIGMRSRKEVFFPLQERPDADDTLSALPALPENLMLAAYAHEIRQLGDRFRKITQAHTGKENADFQTAMLAIEERLEAIIAENLAEGKSDSTVLSIAADFLESDEGSDGSFELPEMFTKQRSAGNSDIISAMWEAIPGITQNSSPIISSEFTFVELFECETVEDCNVIQEKMREMKFASGSRIGKQAEKIMKNFHTEAARDDTAIKVLCAIPRLTEPIAKAIISEYNFNELCDTNFNYADLQDIEVSTSNNGRTRKVGPALSKKIIELLTITHDD